MVWDRFEHPFLIGLVRKTSYICPEESNFQYSYKMKTDEEYSLPYSLLSSYGCYFFEPLTENNKVNPFHWKGIIPPFTDLNLIQISQNEIMVCSENAFSSTILSYIKNAIGLWNENYSLQQEDNVKRLSGLYPGLRVPRFQENLLDLLTAILCSQHTKVENARRWFLFLKNYYRRIYPILSMDPYRIMEESKKVSGKSIGYRARYIKETLTYLSRDNYSPEEELKKIIYKNNVEKSRRELINMKFIGPKTADCFLLNALGDINIPPIDVNVKRVLDRLKSNLALMNLPQASYCKKYICDSESVESCPIYLKTLEVLEGDKNNYDSGCLRAALKIKFNKSGWVQALLFLFGMEFCKSKIPLCQNCIIKENCKGPQIIYQPIKSRTTKHRIKKVKSIKGDFINLLDLYPKKEAIIKEDAIKILNKIKSSGIIGTNRSLMATAYWISARKSGVPLTLKETSYNYEINQNDLFKLIKKCKILIPISLPVLSPKDYVFPLGKKMELNNNIIEEAKKIILHYKLKGHSPIGIAATAIYISAKKYDEKLTLKYVSNVCGISEVTIRKHKKQLNQKY